MSDTPEKTADESGTTLRLFLCWLWVGVPLAWGVWEMLVKSLALFR